MKRIVQPKKLEAALIKYKLIPDGTCRLLEIRMAVGEPAVIRYEVFIHEDEMKALAACFAEAGEESPQ